MSKKISLLIIALCILFSVFFILAQDYIIEETPTPEEDINYYLAKESFNHEELHYVEDYLSNLGDDNFKDENNLKLGRKYLLQVKEQINANEQAREIAKKYLVNLEEIKPNTEDSTIAKEYYSQTLRKEIEIKGIFKINKDESIEIGTSTIQKEQLQNLASRNDIKKIIIQEDGKINFELEEEMLMADNAEINIPDKIGSYIIYGKNGKQAVVQFGENEYKGDSIFINPGKVEVKTFDKRLDYLKDVSKQEHAIVKIGDKTYQGESIFISDEITRIETLSEDGNPGSIKKGKYVYSGKSIIITKDRMEIITPTSNENKFQFRDYDFTTTSNLVKGEKSKILVNNIGNSMEFTNVEFSSKDKKIGGGITAEEPIPFYQKIEFDGNEVAKVEMSGDSYFFNKDRTLKSKMFNKNLNVLFLDEDINSYPLQEDESTMLINRKTGQFRGSGKVDVRKGEDDWKINKLASDYILNVEEKLDPVAGTLAGVIIDVEPSRPRTQEERRDLLIATMRDGITIRLATHRAYLSEDSLDELARAHVGRRPIIIHSIGDTHIITTSADRRRINVVDTASGVVVDIIQTPAEINEAYLSRYR